MDRKKMKGIVAIVGIAAMLGSVWMEWMIQNDHKALAIEDLKYRVRDLEAKNFALQTDMVNREISFSAIMNNHAKRGCPMTDVDRKFLANAQTLIR